MKKQECSIPDGYARVTSVLTPFTKFDAIPDEVLAKAAERGSRVHAFCESYMLGLFLTEIDEDCKNYFEAFKEWFDNSVEKVLVCEERMNSPTYRISGACDLICVLKGDSGSTIVDFKTPATPSDTWQLQTAAYRLLARECLGIECERRICLMLPKNGKTVRVVEYEKHEKDEQLFINALELYRFFGN